MNQLKRLESGIDGLDTLLKGGLIAGSSYIIQGRPGSGKTILANQIGFNHIKQGGSVLFATLLAEPHDRLFQFLSTLSFYDEAQVNQSIQFVSAFDTLENEGLDAVVKLLRREISRQKSTLLVLDGLLNARSKAESPLDTKQFISELQGHAAFAGCTVLFLTSSQLDEGSPEHTMVDGVIEMGEESVGSKTVRLIKLRKTRGSGAIAGAHEFEINQDGIAVYPKIESLLGGSSLHDSDHLSLISSGIPSLDSQIGGGLTTSSVTLIMGPSGAGKTSLGIQFLSGATQDEPGLYFGFHESPQRVRIKARALGHDFSALEKSGAMHIVWNSVSQGMIDRSSYELLKLVEQKNIKRVFIDSLVGMSRLAIDQSRVNEIFTALLGELRSRGVTIMATWETQRMLNDLPGATAPDLSGLMDNLLLIQFSRNGTELQRQLSILKIRDNAYDPSLLEVVMGNAGITLKKV
ncbi:circadian clock protein KaiC [Pseudomonas reinekei]|uniref:non-specific serine/threonine protein kinase n=1 Tax=Pseudomonas reinekei TaxID=395598 RepID=A0A1H0U383_PSERE|nr:ATPase domain-containing protein [Pseudomonas reinekei]KAB0488059.1 AAA family ATPase [Pseudomonas reinekei]OLU05494.1 serine/threonine protein kinase [Pseudomonas reinekei]SDP60601.1 circadian clock protein KaiC [Pseudomonas reinekei]